MVEGTRILDVARSQVPWTCRLHRLAGGVLAPGFIDAQVNGGGGVLLQRCADRGGVRTICDAHAVRHHGFAADADHGHARDHATAVAAVKRRSRPRAPAASAFISKGRSCRRSDSGAHDPT